MGESNKTGKYEGEKAVRLMMLIRTGFMPAVLVVTLDEIIGTGTLLSHTVDSLGIWTESQVMVGDNKTP